MRQRGNRKFWRKNAIVALGLGLLVACSPTEQAQQEKASSDTGFRRETTAGAVVGFKDEKTGSHAWLGMPFAAPPVGDLRWRAPTPVKPWSGDRQAINFSSECVQPAPGNKGLTGQEDCLYLNVWAPATAIKNASLPVMFWIHGGGNITGAGSLYDGGLLAAKQDVVVVSINYRMGYFGWLSHPALAGKEATPEDRSGNFGTLDMIAALKWTRDNIAGFGGDPDRVMVFGESAGGLNTLAMLVSPKAKGLFHRAIKQSGAVWQYSHEEVEHFVDDPVSPGHPMSSPELLLQLLQIDGLASDRASAKARLAAMADAEIAAYLRSKSYAQIDDGMKAAGNANGLVIADAMNAVDSAPRMIGDGAVLPKADFIDTIKSGHHNKVPVMIGNTRDEVNLMLQWMDSYVRKEEGRIIIRDEKRYNLSADFIDRLYQSVYSDAYADALMQAQEEPVFSYRFDWDEQPVVDGVDKSVLLGAAHALEIPFVFGVDQLNGLEDLPGVKKADFNGPGYAPLSEAMMSYWAEFTAAGSPGKGRKGQQPEWTARNADGAKTMLLDTPLDKGLRMADLTRDRETVVAQMAIDPRPENQQERCRLYEDVYKIFYNTRHALMTEEEYTALTEGVCETDQEVKK